MQNPRAAKRALVYALLVFGVGAALPIWSAVYLSPWEGNGYPASLWVAVGSDRFLDLQERNPVLLVALLLVSAGVGWGTYRNMTRRGYSEEARDFVEGPAGSLPDGRTPGDAQ